MLQVILLTTLTTSMRTISIKAPTNQTEMQLPITKTMMVMKMPTMIRIARMMTKIHLHTTTTRMVQPKVMAAQAVIAISIWESHLALIFLVQPVHPRRIIIIIVVVEITLAITVMTTLDMGHVIHRRSLLTQIFCHSCKSFAIHYVSVIEIESRFETSKKIDFISCSLSLPLQLFRLCCPYWRDYIIS